MAKKEKTNSNPASTDGISYRRVKTWQIALAMMQAASGACFMMGIGYVSYAANLGFGISMILAGTLMTAARIFDGVTDPILSFIIDRVNTRFGKIRLFLIIGWIIEALSLKMLYDWCCGKGHSIAIFILIYFVYYIGYTCNNMASQMIGPVMTNDPRQRPMVNVFSVIYNYVVSIVLSIAVAMVWLPKYGNTYTLELLADISTLTVALSAFFSVLAIIGITPIDKPENFTVKSTDNQDKVKPKDMLNLIKSNKALCCFICAATSDKLAMQIVGQSIISTILYGIIIGNMGLGAIINIIGIVPIFICAVIGGKYTGKHGSKESVVFWTKVSIALNGLLVVFIVCTGNLSIREHGLLLVVFALLTMLANGMRITVSTATSTMLADVIDYEASVSGKFMPGIISGVYSFIDKLVSSFGALIATGCVAIIGYKDTIPQPSDPKTWTIILAGCFIVYVIPILGWVTTLVAMKFTPISKEYMVEVQKTIAKNKEQVE